MHNSGNEEKKTYTYDSTGKGNYGNGNGSLLATGSNESYAVNNIYDMAGNLWDWTIEADHPFFRVCRGGGYDDFASTDPASFRNRNEPTRSDFSGSM